jgi:hypothetical protein
MKFFFLQFSNKNRFKIVPILPLLLLRVEVCCKNVKERSDNFPEFYLKDLVSHTNGKKVREREKLTPMGKPSKQEFSNVNMEKKSVTSLSGFDIVNDA